MDLSKKDTNELEEILITLVLGEFNSHLLYVDITDEELKNRVNIFTKYMFDKKKLIEDLNENLRVDFHKMESNKSSFSPESLYSAWLDFYKSSLIKEIRNAKIGKIL